MGASFFIDLKEMWANSANKFFDTLAAGKPPLINYGGWQKELIEKEKQEFISCYIRAMTKDYLNPMPREYYYEPAEEYYYTLLINELIKEKNFQP